MDNLRIEDKGDGWKVYGEYSDGVSRPVYSGPGRRLPPEAFLNSATAHEVLTGCLEFVRERENYLAENA